jgi:aryl-alcohol dehydrogenase-like predicted oxidoreductase
MSASLLQLLDGRRIGLGTMRLCGEGCWGWPRDDAAAVALIRHAIDRGVRLIDTADCYGPDVAELLVARALRNGDDDVIVATKAGVRHPGPGQWIPDARPERLLACCDASLERLGTERIDLLQLHTVDPDVPFAESMGALAELVAAGKVARIGLSNVTVEQLEEARSITPIASVQNRYHLLDRGSDDVLRACEAHDIAFLAWRPLSMVGDELRAVVEQALPGEDPAAVALAWLLQRSAAMVPIPGTSSRTHLDANLDAAGLVLDADVVAALDGLVTDR